MKKIVAYSQIATASRTPSPTDQRILWGWPLLHKNGNPYFVYRKSFWRGPPLVSKMPWGNHRYHLFEKRLINVFEKQGLFNKKPPRLSIKTLKSLYPIIISTGKIKACHSNKPVELSRNNSPLPSKEMLDHPVNDQIWNEVSLTGTAFLLESPSKTPWLAAALMSHGYRDNCNKEYYEMLFEKTSNQGWKLLSFVNYPLHDGVWYDITAVNQFKPFLVEISIFLTGLALILFPGRKKRPDS